MPRSKSRKLKIAISSCLLGDNVRYDGTHKYDLLVVETLGQYMDFLPLCPETGIGLGVPRPAVRLHSQDGCVRALGIDDPGIDITGALTDFGKQQAARLGTVSGYIFKSRSPSCGLADTPIITQGEQTHGSGLYARQIIEAIPLLPVTDETSLRHEGHANHFLAQSLAFNRWQQLMTKPLSATRLTLFHASHKSGLENHHAALTQDLSELLGALEDPLSKDAVKNYLEGFMTILRTPVTTLVQLDELFDQHSQLCRTLGLIQTELSPIP